MSTYMTTAELAEHLTVSISKLKEMIASGAIPSDTYFRHGRTYRFHVERVEESLLDAKKPSQLELDLDDDVTPRS